MQAPTPCKHIISGTISSPSRGTFHLSLTVLVRYRSLCLFSLGRWSSQIQAGFHVSDPTQESPRRSFLFRLRDYYPLWWSFPGSFNYKNDIHVGVLQPPLLATLEEKFQFIPILSNVQLISKFEIRMFKHSFGNWGELG